MNKTTSNRQATKIFKPSWILTRIHKAIDLDLHPPHEQVYVGCDSLQTLSRQMFRDRQREDFDKKFVDPSENQDNLRDLTYMKFLFVNEHMRSFRGNPNLDLPGSDQVLPQSRYSARTNILLRMRALMGFVLTPFLDEEWFHCCKHSGGTSLGVSYSDTSLEAKSLFPISVTSRAKTVMDQYFTADKFAADALYNFNRANPVGMKYEVVTGSRAATVPKSSKIRRMIAVEPTGNMFLQQGLMELMYQRMDDVGLVLSTLPEEHKRRAKTSSITSEEATIDWSSASDCVSIDLLRWLLPGKWFDCLDMVRSPFLAIDGVDVELNMFSTMGNAGTFPLETLLFWTIGHACRLEQQGSLCLFPEWKDLGKVSVFGDDCILKTDLAPLFIEMCESVGFIINDEKSFYDNEGFRESCGGDYLHGYDVRPYCIKAPTSDRMSALEPWLYTIANSLLQKYKTYFGRTCYMYDRELLRTFFDMCNQANISVKIVPDYFPDDAGLRMSCENDISELIENYPAKYSRISRGNHDLYTFLYCKFNYKQNKRRVEELHYLTWLRRPGGERGPWWQTREKGGYVVAKAYSSTWRVPICKMR
jgi:hypothetical protein